MGKWTVLAVLIIAGMLSVCRCAGSAEITEVWSTPRDFKVPESVMFDARRKVLYVSNINGSPTEKNGKGFISRLSTKGRIITLEWITGLNAPKGMGIKENILYVTDIDRIHAVDINAGKISRSWEVAGARFLNDIEIDSNGNVYITDMDTSKVHIIKGGTVSLWIDLGKYNRTNGLFMMKGNLYVGTAEGLLKITLKDKNVAMEIPHSGGIDGLKWAGGSRFIVSDWMGKTQIISRNKKPVVLLDTTDKKINSADIEYIPSENLLLIPTFFDNRVVAYKLKK